MLFEKLVAANEQVWTQYINHQFGQLIVKGELEPAKFDYYQAQDKLYLKGYNSCFLHMATNATREIERKYFGDNQINEIEGVLAGDNQVLASKVTNDYISYMYRIMVTGTNLEKLVALAPCVVGYGQLGQEISKLQQVPNNPFQEWIDVYISGDYQSAVERYIDLLNYYHLDQKTFEKAAKILGEVCQLEIAFFNQACNIPKPNVLTIAGSDSGGGAGIQADLKTISSHQCYGASAITAITAQSTTGVYAIEPVSNTVISKQIEVVSNDLDLQAIKIGMLSDCQTIEAVANSLPNSVPVILDPVMVAKDQTKLLAASAIDCLVTNLFPKALIITPNIDEAELLTGIEITDVDSMEQAAIKLNQMGAHAVLIKGGHLPSNELIDVLYWNGKFERYQTKRIMTDNTHGTGCSLSSAIASNIALGIELNIAVKQAIDYVQNGIVQNYKIGQGKGPINHFHQNIKLLGAKYE